MSSNNVSNWYIKVTSTLNAFELAEHFKYNVFVILGSRVFKTHFRYEEYLSVDLQQKTNVLFQLSLDVPYSLSEERHGAMSVMIPSKDFCVFCASNQIEDEVTSQFYVLYMMIFVILFQVIFMKILIYVFTIQYLKAHLLDSQLHRKMFKVYNQTAYQKKKCLYIIDIILF